MESIKYELDRFREFIKGKTSSKNVLRMYCGRVRKFLEQHPEAICLEAEVTRDLIDDYIEFAPANSAKEVLATAVRYYWHYRFGKPYFARYSQRDFPPNDSIDRELEAYGVFLTKTKDLADVTIVNRIRDARHFLYTMFGASSFSRGDVTVYAVRDYLSYFTPQLSLSTKGRLATDIRSYAGFLMETGCRDTALPILRLPLSFNNKRSKRLPGVIEDDDLRVLIDSIDPSTERGARDLALVLLMGNLGFRVGDAVSLEFDDIDWVRAEITVRTSKSKTPRKLPLDAICGAAIERYVRNYRSGAKTSRIFLVAGGERSEGPVSSAQAGRAVRLAAEKAGIADYAGTHTLRRAVATNMVSAGVDIKTVADILGHERICTSMGYLRLDLNSLREVVAEWPGMEVCHGQYH
jgi:integrase/recombinase XerD